MSPTHHEVVVSEIGGTLAQRIRAGRHELIADEPVPSGGSDRGPDPYALLLAALGACTSMTLRMYANRKHWPLTHVTVRLSQSHVHGRDCAECDSQEDAWIHKIEREIELTGPLSGEQKARLLEIADRCPVHRSLVGPKKIVTRLAEPG